MSPENGWNLWSKHVIVELERLNEKVETIDAKISDINIQLQTLKTEFKIKSGFWGALGGVVPVVILIILKILKLD